MPELIFTAAIARAGFPPQPLKRVYLLVGADDALKQEAVARFRAVALDPAFADFDHEVIDFSGSLPDDSGDPVNRILEAANSAPFASERKMVTVLSVQKLGKERQDALAGALERLGAVSLLLLIADTVEFEAGKPKGKQVETSLKKAVDKVGMTVVCDSPQGNDLRARVLALLKERGKTADPDVINRLMARASEHSPGQGGDIHTLVSETEKLMTYVGERSEITRDDAAQVVPDIVEDNIFRLMDMIGARDMSGTMLEVENLLIAEDRPDATAARTFVMLQRHIRLMYVAKYMAEHNLLGRGTIPDGVKNMLSGELIGFVTGQAYRLTSYARQARNFTWQELELCTERILASDLVMKGIWQGEGLGASAPAYADDPAANLRMLVFDLCRPRK